MVQIGKLVAGTVEDYGTSYDAHNTSRDTCYAQSNILSETEGSITPNRELRRQCSLVSGALHITTSFLSIDNGSLVVLGLLHALCSTACTQGESFLLSRRVN